MADGTTAQERGEEEAPAAPPPKKFRRMGQAASVADMGVMGAFQHLKSEARQLKAAGIAACLEGGEAAMKPHLATYLSGTAARSYEDEVGEEFAEMNQQVFTGFRNDGVEFDTTTGTKPVAFNKELCFALHIDLVERLKTTDLPLKDGSPGLFLDSTGGVHTDPKAKKSGGFQREYTAVNVRAMRFSKSEQDRSVFALTAAEYGKVLGPRGKGLADRVKIEVKDFFKKDPALLQVHVLFHWNDHSFFTYHQDDKGDVAVVVNLSPCTTTDLHVAGAAMAKMEACGEAHILPTHVFHRSGTAPRRCIKLVFFYNLIEPIDVGGDDAGSSTEVKAEAKDEVKVKAEAKDEDEGEGE